MGKRSAEKGGKYEEERGVPGMMSCADSVRGVPVVLARVAIFTVVVATLSFSRAAATPAEDELPTPVAEEPETAAAEAPVAAAGGGKRAELAASFNDPLTTLPQIFIQDAYTPSNYGTEAQTNRVIARLIVPRIPRFQIFPFVQLLRPSLSVVTVPTGKGKATRTEFGDMQLFDLVVIPWPGQHTGLMMGVGPVFVFPTATHETAGQNAWQVGPAFATIYKGIPGVLVGFLVQNPISFAYTSSKQRALNTLVVQPILLKHLWRGLYIKSADASWAFGWHDGSAKTIPLSLGLGYVVPRNDAATLNFFVAGEWMAYRDNAPIAAQTTVRFGVTVGFPQLKLW